MSQKNKKYAHLALLICGFSALSVPAFAAAPDAPTGVTATIGNGTVSVAFTAPANNGGKPITSYLAACGSKSAEANNSPISVSGLTGGVSVSCSVTARNADGSGVASAATNNVTPIRLTAVQSRKSHGDAGTFDIEIERTATIDGAFTVEPRARGAGHTLIFQFEGAVTGAGTATVVPVGSATTAFDAARPNEVVVNLGSIAENRRVTVTLANVNGSVSLPPVSLGFLVGDVDNSRAVDGGDINAIKARTGAATNATNAKFDVNLTGSISAADLSTVRTRAGVPPFPVPAVVPPPTIRALSSTSGFRGTVLTITGTSFTDATSVSINGVLASAFTVNSATSLTATIALTAVAGRGNVVMVTPGGQSVNTAVTAFTVVVPDGSPDVSIDGQTLPTLIRPPATPDNPSRAHIHGGLSGAVLGAYAMDPSRCATSPGLSRSWQQNIDLANYRSSGAVDVFALNAQESLTYKVVIPTTDSAGGFTFLDNIVSGGILAPAFMTITAVPCDFNTSRAPANSATRDSCYQSEGVGIGINWLNFVPPNGVPISYCMLEKGQTYYVNIRFQDAVGGPNTTACPPGLLCGGSFAFN